MWQKIRAENLDCDYVKVFGKREADKLFQDLNSTLTYFTGELAQIKIYGKRYEIPRKQVRLKKFKNWGVQQLNVDDNVMNGWLYLALWAGYQLGLKTHFGNFFKYCK